MPHCAHYVYFCRVTNIPEDYVSTQDSRRSGLPAAADHEPHGLEVEIVHTGHKLFPEATPRVLDLQLKELTEDGLVAKTIYPELPPRSEYAITPLGLTLIPIIDAMIEWGNRNSDLFVRKYGRTQP